MLAGACFAAISDVNNVVELLHRNGDFDLAFALSTYFDLPRENFIMSAAFFLGDVGNMDAAIQILDLLSVSSREMAISRMICRCSSDESQAAEYIVKTAVKNHAWLIQNARQEESIGRDDQAVLSYTLSWQFEKAGNVSRFLVILKLPCFMKHT
jgi:hypothetical protein